MNRWGVVLLGLCVVVTSAAWGGSPNGRVKALFKKGGTIHWLQQDGDARRCLVWHLKKHPRGVPSELFRLLPAAKGERTEEVFDAEWVDGEVHVTGPTRITHRKSGVETEALGCLTVLRPVSLKAGVLQFESGRWYLSRHACEAARKHPSADGEVTPWLSPKC